MAGFPHLAVVDDEEAIIEILSFSLQKSFPDAAITGFNKADEAYNWLTNNEVDLLLTDLNMPEIDGRELINLMQDKSPRTPVFVISGAYGPEELRRIEDSYKNVRVFSKPLLTRELVAAIKEALAHKDMPSESQMRGLDLINYLQMVHLQKKTGEVKVSHEKGEGRIALKSGELILVEFNGDTSDEAFFDLLTLAQPAINMVPLSYQGQDQVQSSFNQLLSEFCRRRDKGELVS